VEAAFHMLPHFAYPMMVLLTLVLLPALLFMPATNLQTLILIDVPLVLGATGSLASFYAMAEIAQKRSAWHAFKKLPAVIALGAGLAPHLSAAVWDGLWSMAGEFVRTPKRGANQSRYRQVSKLPLAELFLAGVSIASVVVALRTGHWLAAPFALLFSSGYSYVAVLVLRERFFGVPERTPALEGASSVESSGMVRAA
jgi:hypothetical protein